MSHLNLENDRVMRCRMLSVLIVLSLLLVGIGANRAGASKPGGKKQTSAGPVVWRDADIGTPPGGQAGSATVAAGKLTMRGMGEDILKDPNAQVHFQYAPVHGDFEIVTRLESTDTQQEGARAGIMLRQDLSPGAPYLFYYATQNYLWGLERNATGEHRYAFYQTKDIPLPVWLKLTRWGKTLTGYYSADGRDWKVIHRGIIYDMPDNLLIGCAVSHGAKTGATTATFDSLRLTQLSLPYQTSWIGNTYGGGEKWVEDHIAAMYVAPDGTCYTQSEWDEGGRWAGIYRDGDVVGTIRDSSRGSAITGDGTILYLGGIVLGGKQTAVRRYKMDGSLAHFPGTGDTSYILLPPDSTITALAVGGGSLFVADGPHNHIRVCNAVSGTVEHEWPCEDPRFLAVDRSNNLWISHHIQGRAVISCYTPAGVDTGRKIEGLVDPGALTIDWQGRLLVAENGPDQQVRNDGDLDTKPTLVGAFGVKGGVYSGVPGEVGENKLPANIVGLGVDRAGNLYIGSDGWSWSGVDIRRYTPTGKMAWRLLGLQGVIDFGDLDPLTQTDVYSAQEHDTLDFSRTQGREWSYKGYTLDPFAFPDDPRLHIGHQTTLVRYLKDRTGQPRRFLFQTDNWGAYLLAYRFEAKHGEIAIPWGMWSDGPIKTQQNTIWPPQQPKSGAWMWQDRNGDGAMQADEFASVQSEGRGWEIDPNGDIWEGGKSIHYFKYQGLDAHGVPQYAAPQTILPPAPFTEIHRIIYLPQTDTLYLAGFTTDHPNKPYDGFNEVGTEMARYNHWHQGKAEPGWRTLLPRDAAKGAITMGMAVAGNYVFTEENFSPRLHIYAAATGVETIALMPGPEVGSECGWLDIPYGLGAFLRSNGEYVILCEEDYKNKILMYRWKPQGARPVARLQQAGQRATERGRDERHTLIPRTVASQ